MNYKALLAVTLCCLLTSCSSLFSMLNNNPSAKIRKVQYTYAEANPALRFFYPDTLNNSYLRKLREGYGLDTLVSGASTEIDKVKRVLDWTSKQWQHNGSNKPAKSDAISILEEAKQGKNFRCVEYGIVCTAALNSIAVPSRCLSIQTFDVEKVKRGAGHVVAETYLSDLNRWVFIDPQFNLIPVLNGTPLNAVEFQRALYQKNKDLKLMNQSGEVSEDSSQAYFHWIGKYLYYMAYSFDQRVGEDIKSETVKGKTRLSLIPVGAKIPTVFQRKYEIDYGISTSSLNDFYRMPEIVK
ncbi:MAG: transglutaminase-like domain-containing protein [Bacteroidales bacterium]|nr:transglutaminase-like domain-containing protein [Bacteroidales bacterium]